MLVTTPSPSLSPSFLKVPDLCEDLLSSVDQPLKIAKDKETGKDYLLCDYNRDGDSYRWVWLKSGRGSTRGAILYECQVVMFSNLCSFGMAY